MAKTTAFFLWFFNDFLNVKFDKTGEFTAFYDLNK